jgi:hypothetical protein
VDVRSQRVAYLAERRRVYLGHDVRHSFLCVESPLTIDWTVNINSLLLTVVGILQFMYIMGRYVMKNESSTLATHADVVRLEKDLTEAKKEWATALMSVQQNLTLQHQTLATMYVTSAEFRMFVRGREQFEMNIMARLDGVMGAIREGHNHES